MTDMSQVTQFNYSLDVKINHIEFKDNFLIKTNEKCKDVFVGRLLKIFLTNRKINEHWTTFCESSEWSVQKNVLQ